MQVNGSYRLEQFHAFGRYPPSIGRKLPRSQRTSGLPQEGKFLSKLPRLCAVCSCSCLLRDNSATVVDFSTGLRGTLREFTEFRVVHFLFTFSNRCELVFPGSYTISSRPEKRQTYKGLYMNLQHPLYHPDRGGGAQLLLPLIPILIPYLPGPNRLWPGLFGSNPGRGRGPSQVGSNPVVSFPRNLIIHNY